MVMSMKKKIARKAVKTTAKHTAHGAASKLKRNPLRASSLLALGAAVGALAGWLLGRKTVAGSPGEYAQAAPAGAAATPSEPGATADPVGSDSTEAEPITPQPAIGTSPIPS